MYKVNLQYNDFLKVIWIFWNVCVLELFRKGLSNHCWAVNPLLARTSPIDE